jgi:hypothetical protein
MKNNQVIQRQLIDYILKVLYRWAVIEAFYDVCMYIQSVNKYMLQRCVVDRWVQSDHFI